MTVLDTNVISEAMRLTANPAVAHWWRQQDSSALFTTAVTEAEILAGIELTPEGRRREELQGAALLIFERFEDRILPFDSDASLSYARILACRKRAGRSISGFDAQIAAITLCHDAVLATRNVADFEGCGIRVVNPWTA